MKSRIKESTHIGAGRFGKGLIASADLPERAIVGYYTGPILTWNNEHLYDSEDQYIAGGQFTHPVSRKKMTYQMVVVGPTRYMNHGHCPDYYSGQLPKHGMLANAQMQSEVMLKIAGHYRPVLVFRTIRDVKKGVELLYDYGVHDDEIYYEVLRRKTARDSPSERRKFMKIIESIEKARFGQWSDATGSRSYQGWDPRNDFYRELLINFLHSPDSILYPTKQMV